MLIWRPPRRGAFPEYNHRVAQIRPSLKSCEPEAAIPSLHLHNEKTSWSHANGGGNSTRCRGRATRTCGISLTNYFCQYMLCVRTRLEPPALLSLRPHRRGHREAPIHIDGTDHKGIEVRPWM